MQTKSLVAAFACLGLLSCETSRVGAVAKTEAKPYVSSSFWQHWGDGLAELSSYDLTFPRYGSARPGVALTIFVAESFSLAKRVKADEGQHSAKDVFPVMKLNLVEDFQTGIYSYNEQTSAFLALAPTAHQPAGHLTKVSFSSQEWCGHSWLQWIRQPAGLEFAGHSYFDGEADRGAFRKIPTQGLSQEQLWFWARGMAEPRLAPGASQNVLLLRSLQHERHSHREPTWTRAVLARSASAASVRVPAGEFLAETWTASIESGPVFEFQVEQAAPHRILAWRSTEGEAGQLLKSERLKYWQMNQPGGEAALEKLGLRPRAARMP